MKVLVLYAYFETANSRNNLKFFCDHGVYPDSNRDYVFIINGDICTIPIPEFSNVRVINRPNIGFDFGAWADAIKSTNLDLYTHFVMLNCSVIGPMLPSYVDMRDWFVPFTRLLTDQTKLVGTTINDEPTFINHVQSMLLCTDSVGLKVLIDAGIFDRNEDDITKNDAILGREVKSSELILRAGYNIDCVLPTFTGRRYTVSGPVNKARNPHVYIKNQFMNRYNVEPLDVIFWKTGWGIHGLYFEKYVNMANQELNRSVENPLSFETQKMLYWLISPEMPPTAWSGHVGFASWLVSRFRPQIVVDLGVDYGHSTFAFGSAGIGQVFGVDWFEGDIHAGARQTYQFVLDRYRDLKAVHGRKDNITLIKGDFAEVAQTFNRQIDLLHIDGLHTYEAVKSDFDHWSPKVRSNGIILFHDIVSFPSTVGKFFNEIEGYHKRSFSHSHGLGVLSKDLAKIEAIDKEWIGKLQSVTSSQGTLYHPVYNYYIK